jgi:hypothetical protein
MAERIQTTISGSKTITIDVAKTPSVLLTCKDNNGNVWSEVNVTIISSSEVKNGTVMLPLISDLYPLSTNVYITFEKVSGAILPYKEITEEQTISNDKINGDVMPILTESNGTLVFSSGANNNWILPALYVNTKVTPAK